MGSWTLLKVQSLIQKHELKLIAYLKVKLMVVLREHVVSQHFGLKRLKKLRPHGEQKFEDRVSTHIIHLSISCLVTDLLTLL